MRFRIGVEVCVQAASIEQLDAVQARAEWAVLQAVADRLVEDPDEGSAAISTAAGLDAVAEAALEAAQSEQLTHADIRDARRGRTATGDA